MNNTYPLTYSQRMIWLTEESIPDTSISNNAGTVRFVHNLDFIIFEKVLNRFIENTESIRLRINPGDNNEPRQYIAEYQFYDLDILDYKNRSLKEFYQWENDMTLIPFKLYDANLFYFALIQLPGNEIAFYSKVHHIITDGWAIVLIVDKILKDYFTFISGIKTCLEEEPSYIEYIMTEQEFIHSKRFLEGKQFWEERYKTIPDFIYLKPRNTNSYNTKSNRIGFSISVETRNQIENLCLTNKTSPFVFFMTIIAIYFRKITDKNDLSIGTSLLNRLNAREKNIVGMFVNLAPFRFMIHDDNSFLEYIQTINHEAKLIMKHQRYPYSLILEDFRKKHNTQDNLFDISLTFHNAKRCKEDYLEESKGRWHSCGHQSNSLSIHISDRENSGEFVFNCNYLVDLFSEDDIRRFFHQIMNLVRHVLENPLQSIARLQLISDEEKQELLTFSNTSPYPEKPIHCLFEEQAAKTPDNIALVFRGKCLTYRELNKKANQLANVLTKRGVGPNHIVGLMVKPSLEMFVGIFGILKAGGAYVPIDPEYPNSRKKYIIQNGNIKLLLTSKKANLDVELIDLKDVSLLQNEDQNLENRNELSDLIYVIYTSGTTGNPNGVMISHRSVANYVYWRIKTYQLTDNDVTLQLLPFIFDGFASNIYACLLSGGKLILGDGIFNAHHLVSEYQVTNMSLVPSIYKEILQKATPESFQSLSFVVLGGEKADPELTGLSQSINSKLTLINEYGPTENTIATTAFVGMDQETLSIIGTPVSNQQVYIMDKHHNLLPAGMPGELCVSGDGLARGYLNNQETTARKFVRNPFEPTKKLYCTGDIAKRHPDGNIEFIGRIDHQVKVRGHRIELYEIKEKLMKHKSIQLAIIVANDQQNLCAYYTVKEAVKVSELRRYLADELPNYMIPQYFKEMDKIPFLPSGKVDFTALPSIERNQNSYEPPNNEIEEALVKIWEEILGLEGIGINDDFFELGGDSIKIIQVIGFLHEYNFKLKVQDFYKWPTIRELSDYIKSMNKEKDQKETYQGIITGEVKLTPIQIWFFECGFTDMHHWNHSILLQSKVTLNKAIIKEVFTKIIEYHDALRMVYQFSNQEITQICRNIEGEKLFVLKQMDLTGYKNYRPIMQKKAGQLQSSIDLSNGPLVNLGLFKTLEGDFLLITIHHLVVDGISWRIILDDLNTLFTQKIENKKLELTYKTESFKEWSNQLYNLADNKEFLEQGGYWRRLEETVISALPKDMDVFEDKVKNSDDIQLKLSKNETEKLLNTYKISGIEIKYIILTALGLAIKEWTGQSKILIDFESHGREGNYININITRTVGWFTNVFPIILNMINSEDLLEQIASVKESVLNTPDNGFGYGILKYLTSAKNKSSLRFNLKPEICFNYFGQIDQNCDTEVFNISNFSTGLARSVNSERQYTLEINCIIVDKEFMININYNRNRHKKDTMMQIMENFRNNLINITNLNYNNTNERKQNIVKINKQTWGEFYKILNKVDFTSKINVENRSNATNINLCGGKIYYKNILLTGATGFLGAHLLAELLEKTDANIYCLIRGASLIFIQNKLLDILNFYFHDKHYEKQISKRIFIINGDITWENLGITESEYRQLGLIIDIVIHTAALVKHFGNYSDFEKVNILGTAEIVKFSLLFQKRLFYISSIGVSGDGQEQKIKNLIFTENDLYIRQNYSDNVYFKSKFLAENLVRNAIDKGLKGTIFRVGNLIGRYSDGHFQVNIDESIFYNILKFIINLKFIPAEIQDISGDFTPVDYCSKFIFELMSIKESEGKVFHLFNPKLIKLKEMVKTLNFIGINICINDKCSFEKYEEIILNEIASQKYRLYALHYIDPRINLNNKCRVTINSTITQRYLNILNLEWPDIDSNYMLKILTYIDKVKFCEISTLSTDKIYLKV
jgi:amino acid adenylation domain-containing protein/thioester reductase-like protein/non-ribosomal peptide synthase protein (TIGR01720 family)